MRREGYSGRCPSDDAQQIGCSLFFSGLIVVLCHTSQVFMPTVSRKRKSVKQSITEVEENQEGSETRITKEVTEAAKQKVTKKRKTKEMAALIARTPVSSLKKAMYIGAHVSSAGEECYELILIKGVENTVPNALHIGANSFALFLKSQRRWKNPPLSSSSRDAFRKLSTENQYDSHKHCLPHGSYLVNLATADPSKATQAYSGFLEDLQRCEALGITLYNFHPGSTNGLPKHEAIARIASQLNKSHEETKEVVTVLENMAGQKNVIGSTFEDLRDIISLIKDKTRVGVCIDTCHTFAAGYDLRSPDSFAETMRQFDELVGLSYLRALHLNDSKAPLSSHRDLHANIGSGFLGLRAFHNVMNYGPFQGLPMILETPIDREDDSGKSKEDYNVWAEEIKLLESLIGMDADSDEFKELEGKLWKKGQEERDRIQGQVDKKKKKGKKEEERLQSKAIQPLPSVGRPAIRPLAKTPAFKTLTSVRAYSTAESEGIREDEGVRQTEGAVDNAEYRVGGPISDPAPIPLVIREIEGTTYLQLEMMDVEEGKATPVKLLHTLQANQVTMVEKINKLRDAWVDRARLIAKIRLLQEWWPKKFNSHRETIRHLFPHATDSEMVAHTIRDLESKGYQIPSTRVLTSNTSNQPPSLEERIAVEMDQMRALRRMRTHPQLQDKKIDLFLSNMKFRRPKTVNSQIVLQMDAMLNEKGFSSKKRDTTKQLENSEFSEFRDQWSARYDQFKQLRDEVEQNDSQDFGEWEGVQEFSEKQAGSRRRAKGKAWLAKINQLRKEKREAADAAKAARRKPIMDKVNPEGLHPRLLDGFGTYFPHLLHNFPRDHVLWPLMQETARVISKNPTYSWAQKERLIMQEKHLFESVDMKYLKDVYTRIGLDTSFTKPVNVRQMSTEQRAMWDSFMYSQLQKFVDKNYSKEKMEHIQREKLGAYTLAYQQKIMEKFPKDVEKFVPTMQLIKPLEKKEKA
ncbi:hypothetical protein PROFUN_00102 [Planoprotostelium fungivorum]|uniref:Xylose isomerase-like TIM barrel domain-containing protein n=1 Tax=Planoprotostelium fungivorum TaxID=1890364 RepID=A0A2P6P0P0_9EUKA|nr:hypothetical protein PROFUN_00102 [Planoprotostelium fungivorum]